MSDHFRRWKPYMAFRAADYGAPCDYEIIQRVKLDHCCFVTLKHLPDVSSERKQQLPAGSQQKNHTLCGGIGMGKALLGLCQHLNAPRRRIVWHSICSICLSADRDLTPYLLPRTTCTSIWRITVENFDHSARLHAIQPLLFAKLERTASPLPDYISSLDMKISCQTKCRNPDMNSDIASSDTRLPQSVYFSVFYSL